MLNKNQVLFALILWGSISCAAEFQISKITGEAEADKFRAIKVVKEFSCSI